MNYNSGKNKKYALEAQINLIFVKAVKQSKGIKSLVSFKFYSGLLLKDYNTGHSFSLKPHKVYLKMSFTYKLVFFFV